jgi:hypothetical protein
MFAFKNFLAIGKSNTITFNLYTLAFHLPGKICHDKNAL